MFHTKAKAYSIIRPLLWLLLSYSLAYAPLLASESLFDIADPVVFPVDTQKNTLLITSMTRSSSGLLWAASHFHGLHQYDGYEFRDVSYQDNEGNALAKQAFSSVVAAANGIVWAASASNGLYRLCESEQSFQHFSHNPNDTNSIPGNSIYTLLLDGEQGLWISSDRGLEYLSFHNKKFQTVILANLSGSIRSLSYDFKGHLLLGSDQGLFRISPPNNRIFLKPLQGEKLLDGVQVSTVKADQQSQLWVGSTTSGLYLINAKGQAKNIAAIGRVTSVELVDNEVWVLSLKNHRNIQIFDRETAKLKRILAHDPFRPGGLSDGTLWSLYHDKEGIVWLGGLSLQLIPPARRYSRNILYSPIKPEPGFKADLSGIVELDNGNFWVSSRSEGVDVFSPKSGFVQSLALNNNEPSLPSKHIVELGKEPNGDIWLLSAGSGTWRYRQVLNDNGSATWKKERCLLEGHANSLSSATNIHPLNKELTFLVVRHGAERGTYRYNKKSTNSCEFNKIAALEGISPRSIVSYDDQNSLLLFGNKIYIFDSNNSKLSVLNLEIEAHKNAILPTLVKGYRTSSGKLFFSTADTTYQLKAIKQTSLIISEVLTGRNENWLFDEDIAGNLWGFGAYWLKDAKQAQLFDKGNGNITGAGASIKFWHSPNDDFIFLTQQGMQLLRPSAFSLDQSELALIVNKVRIDGKAVQGQTQNIALQADQHSFSVSFSALEYVRPLQIKYRYRLDGYNNNWIETDAKARHASYTNLSPGQYTFRLQASQPAAAWPNKELTVQVNILPAWYETDWFRLIAVLLVSALLYIIYLCRLRYYRHKKIELEKLVNARTADLAQSMQQLKDTQEQLLNSEKQAALGRLVAGVAHQINTPLGVVKMAASMVADLARQSFKRVDAATIDQQSLDHEHRRLRSSTTLLDSNLQRLSALVESFKKISVDEADWKLTEFNVAETIAGIPASLHDQIEENHIQLYVSIDPNLDIYSYPELLHYIVCELLKNAVTHAYDGVDHGQAIVSLKIKLCERHAKQQAEQLLLIQVDDNGQGIGEALRDKLFDPFTAAKPTNLGLGLHILVNLINKVLHGELSVYHNPHGGCSFKVSYPLSTK
ncbi:sensor histidine kinase [uncultured Pseudoteredinibacter sp.]|uniref:sensor histidine kinase n=1 Tax=uncultured Pseudoteredinibacter sp. TaxID=1641701 RepID=UPI0026239EF4|nr:sensor histidine kinase [uncultured Pseudoteredinibacter sp.]